MSSRSYHLVPLFGLMLLGLGIHLDQEESLPTTPHSTENFVQVNFQGALPPSLAEEIEFQRESREILGPRPSRDHFAIVDIQAPLGRRWVKKQ